MNGNNDNFNNNYNGSFNNNFNNEPLPNQQTISELEQLDTFRYKQGSSLGGSDNSLPTLETVIQRPAGISHLEEAGVLTARESYKTYASNMKNQPGDNVTENGEEVKGILERKKIAKIVATAVAGVLAGQIFLGAIVVAGVSIANPDFAQKLSAVFLDGQGTSTSTSAPLLGVNGSGTVRNIVVEKADTPIVAIAEKVGPSVVGIKVTARVANAWPFGSAESSPEGSGIIIRSDGYIMTNNHVIDDAMTQRSNKMANNSKIEVILPQQKDKPYNAVVVGRDERTDLAVLKIEATDLPAVEIGNSDDIKIGELAIAIGNPGGLEYMGSVTAGIISGLNRTIPVEDGKELKLIQTDAAINPGNSGGALVNAKGQLIGINTAKIGGQGFEGLGFAIPINKAKEVTDSLIEYKYVKGRPLFGIVADPRYTDDMAKEYGMPMGVLVSEVTPFTGAYDAGIRPQDIITKFDGKPVKTVMELNEIKNKFKPGDSVEVEIYRNNKYENLKVKLMEDKK